MDVRTVLLHLLPQVPDLLAAGTPGVFQGQGPDALPGHLRPVLPDPAHQIQFIIHLGAAERRRLGQVFAGAAGHGPAVKAEDLTGAQTRLQPLTDGGYAGLSHLHQLDAGTTELI